MNVNDRSAALGMVVRYQCEEMYNGTPTASCGDDGMYMVSGLETGLRQLEHGDHLIIFIFLLYIVQDDMRSYDMRQYDMINMSSIHRIYINQSLSSLYMCSTLRAYHLFTSDVEPRGRCRRECGAPPAVEHAAPRFNNSQVADGWLVGMACPYDCDPGDGIGSTTRYMSEYIEHFAYIGLVA